MGEGDEAEEAFLDALKQDPDDDMRVVYTDWLEERADPRAEYLRLEAEFHELGATANDLDARQLELLGKKHDPAWCAIVTRPRVVAPPPKAPPPAKAPPTTKASPASPVVPPTTSAHVHVPILSPLVTYILDPPAPMARWKKVAYSVFLVGAFLLVAMPKKWTVEGFLEAFVALFDQQTIPRPP